MRFATTNTFVANTAMMHFAQGNPRCPLRVGTLDAIDFVAIAIPSLRSLRFSHNSRHFPYYATRSQAKKQHSLAHLYNTSSPTLDSVVALRLQLRLRLSNLKKKCDK